MAEDSARNGANMALISNKKSEKKLQKKKPVTKNENSLKDSERSEEQEEEEEEEEEETIQVKKLHQLWKSSHFCVRSM